MSYKDAANIEGPYWDYSELIRWARNERDTAAWLCSKYLLQGRHGDAQWWALEAGRMESMRERISARYDKIKDQPAVRWIGWDRL